MNGLVACARVDAFISARRINARIQSAAKPVPDDAPLHPWIVVRVERRERLPQKQGPCQIVNRSERKVLSAC